MNKYKILLISFLLVSLIFIPNPVYADTEDLDVDGDSLVNPPTSGGSYVGGAGDYTNLATADGDTSYWVNGSSSIFLWTFDNSAIPVGSTINSVTFRIRVKDPSSPYTTFRLTYYDGSSYYSSNVKTSTGAYANYIKTWNTNPGTGLAWTTSQINNGEFGVVTGINIRITRMYLIVDYTAPSLSTVTTDSADNITYSGSEYWVDMNGSVDDDGGADITERGFAWSTTSNSTNPGNQAPPATYTDNWTEGGASLGEDDFSHTENLTACTTYYYRAYARNSQGYTWGDEEEFTTLCTPSIATVAATYVTATTVRLNSSLISDGGQAADVRFAYGTSSGNCTLDASCATGSCNVTSYDTATAWVEDTYTSGQSPYVDIIGLTAGTTYYFCVQGRNDVACECGGELSFTTESGVTAPSNFIGIAYPTSISLSWVKGTGSTNTLIRYKLGSYPTSTVDGTLVYFDEFSSIEHTDLTPGTTYYYRAWGESGGTYTTDNATLMITTLAATEGLDDIPLPDEPTSWFQAPDYSVMANMPHYPIVHWAAEQFSFPRSTMWYLYALLVSTAAGIIFYSTFGNQNLMLSLIVVAVTIGFYIIRGLIPGWHILIVLVLFATGVVVGQRR